MKLTWLLVVTGCLYYAQNVRANRNAQCDFCMLFVSETSVMIDIGMPDNQIIANFNQACKYIAPNFTSECKSLVSKLPYLIQQLKAGANQAPLCVQLGFCTSKTTWLDAQNYINKKPRTSENLLATWSWKANLNRRRFGDRNKFMDI